jgi:hypothetical protein
MARSRKCLPVEKPEEKTPERASRVSQSRRANHLKDEVYREMLRLEASRPGSEMALALALLRAIVQTQALTEQAEYSDWLKAICPVGLRMIEISLGEYADPN